MHQNKEEAATVEVDPMEFATFLETQPPNQKVRIREIWEAVQVGTNTYDCLSTPEIQLHCTDDACNGMRFYRSIARGPRFDPNESAFMIITYKCANCRRSEKTFSLAVSRDPYSCTDEGVEGTGGHAQKLGESPSFGPPTSARLIKLIGPDRDIFLKGRQCENLGLGVGAFAYYRRVVENQKLRILQQIEKVATKIGMEQSKIDLFAKAARETQFSKAMDIAKPALPESLLIDGHNPLGALHSALSEGIHALSDHECLEIAGSVRIVLGELSDRIAQALKDEAEIKTALGILLNQKSKEKPQ